MAEVKIPKPSGLRRKASLNVSFCVKKEKDANYKKVSKALQKDEKDRTEDDVALISSLPNVVKQVKSRLEKRKQLLLREAEVEDSAVLLEEKCRQLADAIRQSQYFVVYSGAGVSTAASIPDYRGSNGIWTRLQQGKDIGEHDLTLAEPTTAHMALFKLYRQGILRHIVSQNCDGLHLRSGVPRKQLSEVHGNMYLEVCTKCNLQVWREFDVTQHTARYAHKTARRCSQCCEPLRDTIVHFGERGSLPWPINWNGACFAAKQADLILCIGSSLKVLKKYPWLWGMDKPMKKRPKLYIVNLQWTPKDSAATLKINGKCDEVMKLVMAYLNLIIPKYDRSLDPIFSHATKLHPLEEHTIASQLLVVGPDDAAGVSNHAAVSHVIPSHLTHHHQSAIEVKEEIKEEELLSIVKEEDVEKMEVVKEEVKEEDHEVFVSEKKLEKIVLEIKKEKEFWRPFQTESGEGPSGSPSPSCSLTSDPDEKPFSLQVEVFDKVYSEITKKILKETDLEYYEEMYGVDEVVEPLDLSMPKESEITAECQFCYSHYSAEYCQFYRRRETKLPPTGSVCYCCDTDDDTETELPLTQEANVGDKKQQTQTPTNPGWFGKGYRKRLKKKR